MLWCYSIVRICSRICSISTLSATADWVISALMDLNPWVLDSQLNSCILKSRRRPQTLIELATCVNRQPNTNTAEHVAIDKLCRWQQTANRRSY